MRVAGWEFTPCSRLRPSDPVDREAGPIRLLNPILFTDPIVFVLILCKANRKKKYHVRVHE